jgi:hypothetical protein
VKIMFKNAVSGHLIIFCIKISGTVWWIIWRNILLFDPVLELHPSRIKPLNCSRAIQRDAFTCSLVVKTFYCCLPMRFQLTSSQIQLPQYYIRQNDLNSASVPPSVFILLLFVFSSPSLSFWIAAHFLMHSFQVHREMCAMKLLKPNCPV